MLVALLALFALFVLAAAIFPNSFPAWTGFGRQPHPNGWVMIPYRTLWDWMDLLLVPFFIGMAAAFIGHRQQRQQLAQQEKAGEIAAAQRANELHIASEQAQQDELESYYLNMGNLILNFGLGGESEQDSARALARARTLIALDGINGERKGQLLRFLYEAELIETPDPVIDLFGANLDDVTLRFEDLRGAHLAGANLRDASLIGVDLSGANLNRAHLNRATLRCALLAGATAAGARFSAASLRDADLRRTVLDEATFAQADAGGSDWRDAAFGTAVLDGADLSEAMLHGADLRAAGTGGSAERPFSLSGARYDDATQWPPTLNPAALGARLAPVPDDLYGRCGQVAGQYRREDG